MGDVHVEMQRRRSVRLLTETGGARTNSRHRKKLMAFLFVGSIVCLAVLFAAYAASFSPQSVQRYPVPKLRFWNIQAIDTMKDSRDRARETLNNPSFDKEINTQLANIAAAGATHVAIATPYDDEFIPLLKRWVASARAQGLSVWFRGNWAGWERWFGYRSITRAQHLAKTKQFIAAHPELFADGDIFDPCPECENGGPGDPRTTRDHVGHAAFLTQLRNDSEEAFEALGTRVTVGVFSMNGDVARLIMGNKNADRIGSFVTVDHYVPTPEKLAADVGELGAASRLPVLLGEFGAPIPDIHGPQEHEEQAAWLSEALGLLARQRQLVGLNYWTYRFGSTALWSQNNTPLPAADALIRFYKPQSLFGVVTDLDGAPIPNALITTVFSSVRTTRSGYFEMPYVAQGSGIVTVTAPGYEEKTLQQPALDTQLAVSLKPQGGLFWYSVIRALNQLNGALTSYSVPLN